MIDIIKTSKLYLKGIFTHIYDALNKDNTNKQIEKFKYITSDIDLNKIDIDHIKYSSNYIETIPYELICNVSKRVPRKYVK